MRLFSKTIVPALVIFGSQLLAGGARAASLQDAESVLQNTGKPAFGEQAEAFGREPGALAQVIGNLINIALYVVGGAFLILLIYGGYIWMIARGDTEKVTKAKDIITNALIGLVIIFLAYAITAFVVSRLTDITLEGAP